MIEINFNPDDILLGINYYNGVDEDLEEGCCFKIGLLFITIEIHI